MIGDQRSATQHSADVNQQAAANENEAPVEYGSYLRIPYMREEKRREEDQMTA